MVAGTPIALASVRPAAGVHAGPRRVRIPRPRQREPAVVVGVCGRDGGAAGVERAAAGISAAERADALAGHRPAETALSPGMRPGFGPGLLGLVLASGVRIRPPHCCPAAVRVRL